MHKHSRILKKLTRAINNYHFRHHQLNGSLNTLISAQKTVIYAIAILQNKPNKSCFSDNSDRS
ncbi:MAG: hypothetical protein QNJ70_00460 [Xenococcaceae cyanobacterium MO_207.B15]|nr:hypothetical protein [Xenococcaceae cyanobacterium MO_207.B15]